jgi:hypothetical protein
MLWAWNGLEIFSGSGRFSRAIDDGYKGLLRGSGHAMDLNLISLPPRIIKNNFFISLLLRKWLMFVGKPLP